MQTTFRVDLATHSKGRDGGLIDGRQRPFVARKTHTKSRGGCVACKKRRIKCDESRPNCTRCSRMGIHCEYPSPVSSPGKQTALIPTTKSHSMAVSSACTQLADYLGNNGSPHQIRHDEGLKALRHFQEATCHTFGGDMITQVMHQVVRNNVWQYPFLTHMVIAVSSGHQRRLLGQSSHTKRLRSLEFEEMNHWQTGLQMFQSKLSTQTSRSGPELMDFDSVVSAIFLTIVFTLAMQDGNTENRSVTQEEDFVQRIIDPMSSTGGFRALQAIQATPNETSVWMSALDTADDPNGTFTSRKPGIEGLPTAFVQLCQLDEHSSSDTNPYHAILRHLTPLLQMKPAPRNWSKLFAFSGRLHSTFRPLVAEKDPRALLLLAWWLTLLRQVDEWWIKSWATSACGSIVAYLSASTDPRVQSLLVFPATFGTADISWTWRDELDST